MIGERKPLTHVRMVRTTGRWRWLLFRNYLLQIAIQVLYGIAQFLNEQFYLVQRRPVISGYFEEPSSSGNPLFWSRWIAILSRWFWGLSKIRRYAQGIDELRRRALTLSLALTTYLRNRLYHPVDANPEVRRLVSKAFVRLSFAALVFALLQLAAVGLPLSPTACLAVALVVAILPCIKYGTAASPKESD